MQIVIEIPDVLKTKVDNTSDKEAISCVNWFDGTLVYAIRNGTVLPEQYGDLIDRDELLKSDVGKIMGFRECDIRNAPTILEGTVIQNEDIPMVERTKEKG